MSNTNPFTYIHTGLIIRLLRHAQDFSINSIINESKKLKRNLQQIDFRVSHQGLDQLNDLIETLEEEEEDNSRKLTVGEVNKLNNIMAIIEQMVFAEANIKEIYILPDTRFNIDHLMNKPDKLFSKNIFNKMSPIAINDINEGFQCIVHSRPTASAFHMLRGTEGVLKQYYFEKIKQKREKKPMWGNMVKHLLTKKKKNEMLLTRLNYIKDNYRNPTAHPELFYTFDTAQDLISLCIDVINAMGNDLHWEN
jgi:hypothetical protein